MQKLYSVLVIQYCAKLMVKKAICNLFTFFIHFLVPGSEDDPGSRAGSSDLKPIYNIRIMNKN